MDKRYFHKYLNDMKDSHLVAFGLIESIQTEFESTYEAISDKERKALRNEPLQYIVGIPDGESWTTQLHIWAEQGVPEILKLDPIFLAYKNGYGDSVLMSMVAGATGTHTEQVNYKLIFDILNTDMEYEYLERDGDKEITMKANALDETDANGDTILDYLIDYAFSTGKYKGQPQDDELQAILRHFAGYIEEVTDNEPEVIKVETIEEPEKSDIDNSEKSVQTSEEITQLDEDNSSLTKESTLE